MRVVIVEVASRFARHLLTQEAGISLLVGLGVRVLTAAGDDLTDSDDEFRVAMRQIMGVFSQLEKTRLVKKLKAARDRKRANGKVEGRKSHLEARPEVVAEAKRLHRASPKTGERRSLRKIAAELATLGHLNVNGRPTAPSRSAACWEGPRPSADRQQTTDRAQLIAGYRRSATTVELKPLATTAIGSAAGIPGNRTGRRA